MGRKNALNRPQTQKDRELSRVRRVQGIRQSNAAGPHMSGPRYSRAATRNAMLRGDFDYFDSF
jgi:hypothetical protein